MTIATEPRKTRLVVRVGNGFPRKGIATLELIPRGSTGWQADVSDWRQYEGMTCCGFDAADFAAVEQGGKSPPRVAETGQIISTEAMAAIRAKADEGGICGFYETPRWRYFLRFAAGEPREKIEELLIRDRVHGHLWGQILS